jgi:hypothetical protein
LREERKIGTQREGTAYIWRLCSQLTGWPEEFGKYLPKMEPNPFVLEIDTKIL